MQMPIHNLTGSVLAPIILALLTKGSLIASPQHRGCSQTHHLCAWLQASSVVGGRLKELVLKYTADASPRQGPELAAQHLGAIVAALPHLQTLYLGWPWQDSPQPVLPDLAPLTRLISLTLSCSGERARVCWRPEHVLQVLCGRESTLQVLSLERFELVSPHIALMLSERFPILQQLHLTNCKGLLPQTGLGAGTKEQEEQALDQLRQLLRPGLELSVGYEEAD
jgi:hypothetical protein